MSQLPEPALIDELEARQDVVLRELDELDRRIEGAIAEFAALKPQKRGKPQAA